jgi:uncharacterized protein YciI
MLRRLIHLASISLHASKKGGHIGPPFVKRNSQKCLIVLVGETLNIQKRMILFQLLLLFFGIHQVLHAAESQIYDAGLAKRLGADEHGMKNYVLGIIKTGPNDGKIKGKEREEIFAGHMANIQRLADQGKLAVAGPFGKNDKAFRGLFLFNVDKVEEAKQLAARDPAIKAGVFVIDLIPWYGSAALMMTNEIHQKITKPGTSQP